MKVAGVLFVTMMLISCAESSTTEKTIDASNYKTVSTSTLQVPSDSVKLDPIKGLVFYKGQPFSGTSVSHHPNGVISQKIDYHLGKKEGFFIKQFEDGSLSFKSFYANGKLQGKSYSWWRNGNKRSESNYVDGITEGEQLQWYKSGAKFKRLLLVAGKEEGMQVSWRENGKIYNNYEAKNGRIFGLKRAALCYQLDDEIVQYKDK